MRQTARVLLATFVLMTFGLLPTAAQVGPKAPAFRGEWNPVVGVGAAYLVQAKGERPTTWEVAVVGQEAGGHWVEMSFTGEEGFTIVKHLMTPDGVKRMIMKAGNEPAMELPVFSTQGRPHKDAKEGGKFLGQERVTTPAGAFLCDRYRVTEGGETVDVWITAKVSPYGLVKMTSPTMTMTLQKILTGVKTRITETPQKFELPQMPGMPGMEIEEQEE